MLYRVQQLQKVAGGRRILDIRSLTIEAGGSYALLGANGAGKTTLLNLLAFLDSPTSGIIEFDGRPVRFTRNRLQQLRREVVLVEQHPVLFSTSVKKNIEFGLKVRKVNRAERDHIVDAVLDMVDLACLRDEPVRGLSGGEVQRIALARGLALSPRVLLCDEPTSSVDAENQAAITAILKEINDSRQITIIFTTHDRLQAAGLARQTLVLEKGSFAATGYDNVFSCVVDEAANNRRTCFLQNSVRLLLSDGQDGIGSAGRRVSIDPHGISLLKSAPPGDMPGVLQGTVVQLTAENGGIRMMVDVGLMITVLLEQNRYLQASPAIGDNVYLQIQIGALQSMTD